MSLIFALVMLASEMPFVQLPVMLVLSVDGRPPADAQSVSFRFPVKLDVIALTVMRPSQSPGSLIVNPGETMFIPSGFWHRTQCDELSIAVTWNSVSRANWPAFVEDRYLHWTRHSPLKLKVKQAYFALLNLGLRRLDA